MDMTMDAFAFSFIWILVAFVTVTFTLAIFFRMTRRPEAADILGTKYNMGQLYMAKIVLTIPQGIPLQKEVRYRLVWARKDMLWEAIERLKTDISNEALAKSKEGQLPWLPISDTDVELLSVVNCMSTTEPDLRCY